MPSDQPSSCICRKAMILHCTPLFGLGKGLDKVFGLKWVLTELN